MRSLATLVLLASVPMWGQANTAVFDQAPPAVDQALRDRVTKFYQFFLESRFRLADQYVAEVSKDAFFNMQKNRIYSQQLIKISYSENFTHARVVVLQEMDWVIARLGKQRVKTPVTSNWKLENGDWLWYVEPVKEIESPFGTLKPGEDIGSAPTAIPQYKWTDVEALQKLIKVDRLKVQLSSYAVSDDAVTITNGTPGEATLRLPAIGIPGLSFKLEKAVLKAGESGQVRFHYEPPNASAKSTVQVDVTVDPVALTIPLRLTFAIPPEIERQLPPGLRPKP